MSLANILNDELTNLKYALQRDKEEEIQARCGNLNYSLGHVRYPAGLPSLRLSIYIDQAIHETPTDNEVYRPNAHFWQRVMPNHRRGVPLSFSIHQPLLQNSGSFFYGVQFVYGGPHKVECRIYIEGALHAPQSDDDLVFEEPEQPCLVVFPHEILTITQNGRREVTDFTW
jgi:hypothetical protein